MKAIRVLSLALLAVLCAMVNAQAQVTSISLVSDPGDFIGGGQTTFLTPADGTFSGSSNSTNSVVTINFFGQPGVFWFFDFASANGQPLTVGSYTGAARWPFQAPTQPGLSVSGDGRGCNTLTGSFVVLEASYSGTTLNSFDATFEQHCEGAAPALRGEIRFNANPTVSVVAPSHLTVPQGQNVHFTVSATDASSLPVALTATGLPTGATFVDNGDNTGTFDWTPATNVSGNFLVNFLGTDTASNAGAATTQITVIVPPPPNDDFNQATVIPSEPFTVTQDVTNATVAPDDPFCVTRNQTVWFAFTPTTNIRLEANTFGSNYDTTLSVYTGTRGGQTQIGCNDDSNGTLQSRVRFNAVAGTTYFFMVSSFSRVSGANLVFNLLEAPPLLSINPSVNQFGSVDPSSGTATISGSVECSAPAFVTLSGQLKQTHGQVPVTGFFEAFVPCNGTTPWSADIQTTTTLFHGRAADLFTGGQADVSATATAFDFENGVFVQRNLAVTIILRGKQ